MVGSERKERLRRLMGRGLLAAALVVAGASMASANAPVDCGESMAPQCGGACPAGQRCLPTFAEIFIVIVENEQVAQPASRGQAPQDECACFEALCAGVPLDDGQGCCNGVPFTIGVQGCCDGQIQDVGEPCDCTDDLAELGCCTIDFNGGSQSVLYDANGAACCQNSPSVGGVPATTLTAYTLNSGVDCCSSGGSASQTCGGPCQGSECAASGCCTCGECEGVDAPFCAVGDTELGCDTACFLGGVCFENLARFDNAVCSRTGACQVTDPAAAPTVSQTGMFAAIGILLLVAAGALARRRLADPLP
jgi:hypothetical protein